MYKKKGIDIQKEKERFTKRKGYIYKKKEDICKKKVRDIQKESKRYTKRK